MTLVIIIYIMAGIMASGIYVKTSYKTTLTMRLLVLAFWPLALAYGILAGFFICIKEITFGDNP